jgi:hypothetical protein
LRTGNPNKLIAMATYSTNDAKALGARVKFFVDALQP